MLAILMLLYSLYSYCIGDFNPYRARLECGSSYVRAQTGRQVRPKTTKTSWFGIKIMCPSVYLWTVVSVSQHHKNTTNRVSLVQIGPHHHLIEN